MFARNRGGAYVRNGPSPVQPRTVYQNSVRAALSMASIGWGSLSDSNRMAWREWAKLNPIKNRIGQSVTLQANAAYVQLNARLAHLGIAMGTTPPTVGAPTGLITLSLGADIGAGDFEVVYTATPLGANKRLILEGCNVGATNVDFVENLYRVFFASAANASSPQDIESAWSTRFGVPSIGDHLYVRGYILDDRNGLISGALVADNDVVST